MIKRLWLVGGWLWLATASAASPGDVRVEQAVTSTGRLRIELWAAALPLKHGLQTLSLRVTEAASGKPTKGCHLALKPWMPDMGHGIDEVPPVVAQSAGQFRIEGLDLFMPGKWELRFQVSGCEESTAVIGVHLR